MCWIYVLKSEKDGRYYIGSTRDIEKRIDSHKRGKVRSTKGRRPLRLVYTQRCENIREARKRENFLKSGQGRKWIKENLK
jgi:putative endonuclease